MATSSAACESSPSPATWTCWSPAPATCSRRRATSSFSGSEPMLAVGLNPYGLTYVLGLQGRGTPRANPGGSGLAGFIAIASELGARTLEIFEPWLAAMSEADLGALKERLAGLGMTPVVSTGFAMGPI